MSARNRGRESGVPSAASASEPGRGPSLTLPLCPGWTRANQAGPGGLYVGTKCQGRKRRPPLEGGRGPFALDAWEGGGCSRAVRVYIPRLAEAGRPFRLPAAGSAEFRQTLLGTREATEGGASEEP